MSVVKKLSEWPRRETRYPIAAQPKPGVSAQIYILPCIRREPLRQAG